MKISALVLALVAAGAVTQPAVAQRNIIAPEHLKSSRPPKVQVAKGVMVTPHTYGVIDNEAPFFNFGKTHQIPAEDEDYVTTVLGQVPNRSDAARMLGYSAVRSLLEGKDAAAAGRRLNQAFFIDNRESVVYHGFAMLVSERFHDYAFADELMQVAARMNLPVPTLKGDHGRILLLAGRPRDARPLLEKGIEDDPDWAVPRANLAVATYQLGNAAEACRLAKQVRGREVEFTRADMEVLRTQAKC